MAAEVTTFPLTESINLVVKLAHGSVVVNAVDDEREAVVKLSARDSGSDVLDRFTVELRGSTLLVAGPRQGGLLDLISNWRRDRDAVDVVVEIPVGTPVKVSSASADVSGIGRCGTADIVIGAANVHLDAVAGDFRLRCGSGETHVGSVAGGAHVRAGSGSAHFGDVGGVLECGFGSGTVTAESVRGGVRVRGGAGSAEVGATYGDVDIAFGSGPIRVGLPAGTPARVDVTSGSGHVHSDLAVESAPAKGGEPISIRARTGSGDVHLSRATPAA
jgi:hypothetical protein